MCVFFLLGSLFGMGFVGINIVGKWLKFNELISSLGMILL